MREVIKEHAESSARTQPAAICKESLMILNVMVIRLWEEVINTIRKALNPIQILITERWVSFKFSGPSLRYRKISLNDQTRLDQSL